MSKNKHTHCTDCFRGYVSFGEGIIFGFGASFCWGRNLLQLSRSFFLPAHFTFPDFFGSPRPIFHRPSTVQVDTQNAAKPTKSWKSSTKKSTTRPFQRLFQSEGPFEDFVYGLSLRCFCCFSGGSWSFEAESGRSSMRFATSGLPPKAVGFTWLFSLEILCVGRSAGPKAEFHRFFATKRDASNCKKDQTAILVYCQMERIETNC